MNSSNFILDVADALPQSVIRMPATTAAAQAQACLIAGIEAAKKIGDLRVEQSVEVLEKTLQQVRTPQVDEFLALLPEVSHDTAGLAARAAFAKALKTWAALDQAVGTDWLEVRCQIQQVLESTKWRLTNTNNEDALANLEEVKEAYHGCL